MTVIMTFFGVIVFIVSAVKRGFKVAFKRLMLIIIAGFVVDMLIFTLAFAVLHASLS